MLRLSTHSSSSSISSHSASDLRSHLGRLPGGRHVDLTKVGKVRERQADVIEVDVINVVVDS